MTMHRINQPEGQPMPTTQEVARAQIVAMMAAARGQIVTADESILYHGEPNRAIYLADNPKQSKEDAITVLQEAVAADNEYNSTSRVFHHRPGDGAVAVNWVMHDLFGQLLGHKTWVQDPQQLDVEISYGVHKQVPYGLCKLPPEFGRKALLSIGATIDPVYGPVLKLEASSVLKALPALENLFDRVQERLETHSIYRGQAIYASEVPKFMDVQSPSREVVFTERTSRRLDFKLFSLIENEHIHLELGNDGKIIIWLHGDFGTGKSELLAKLSRMAQRHGFSVIQVRPGIDSWDFAMQLVKMLAPRCFCIVEDAESVTGVDNPGQVAKMLDQLDGTDAKTIPQSTFVFTTNYIDKVQKAATRPGRADAIIRLGNLDRPGCERLAELELGDQVSDDIDYDRVYAACGGVVLDDGGLPALNDDGGLIFKAEADITPAFMRQAFNIAKTAAALERGLHAKVTTENLLAGIEDLQEQLLIHNAAPEPKPREQLNVALAQALSPMVNQVIAKQLESYTSTIYEQAREAADSVVETRIHGANIVRETDGETWASVRTQ